jgi:hypothetical protein
MKLIMMYTLEAILGFLLVSGCSIPRKPPYEIKDSVSGQIAFASSGRFNVVSTLNASVSAIFDFENRILIQSSDGYLTNTPIQLDDTSESMTGTYICSWLDGDLLLVVSGTSEGERAIYGYRGKVFIGKVSFRVGSHRGNYGMELAHFRADGTLMLTWAANIGGTVNFAKVKWSADSSTLSAKLLDSSQFGVFGDRGAFVETGDEAYFVEGYEGAIYRLDFESLKVVASITVNSAWNFFQLAKIKNKLIGTGTIPSTISDRHRTKLGWILDTGVTGLLTSDNFQTHRINWQNIWFERPLTLSDYRANGGATILSDGTSARLVLSDQEHPGKIVVGVLDDAGLIDGEVNSRLRIVADFEKVGIRRRSELKTVLLPRAGNHEILLKIEEIANKSTEIYRLPL